MQQPSYVFLTLSPNNMAPDRRSLETGLPGTLPGPPAVTLGCTGRSRNTPRIYRCPFSENGCPLNHHVNQGMLQGKGKYREPGFRWCYGRRACSWPAPCSRWPPGRGCRGFSESWSRFCAGFGVVQEAALRLLDNV